jgi:hypothetical protein
VSAHAGAIESRKIKVDAPQLAGAPLKGIQGLLPQPIALPAAQAGLDGAPGAIALGNVAPGRPGAQAPQEAIEHLAVTDIRVAGLAAVFGGQEGGEHFVFLIGEVMTSNVVDQNSPPIRIHGLFLFYHIARFSYRP